jgi:hypothetical protein
LPAQKQKAGDVADWMLRERYKGIFKLVVHGTGSAGLVQ